MCARRAVEQELSRERILEEARELFVLKGYDAVTMRSIAKSLGYSHGALYYHFKDKAELFYALIVEDFDLLLSILKKMSEEVEEGSIAGLKQMMLEFIKFGLTNPHHYEIMFVFKEPELKRHSRTKQAQCLELFATFVLEVTGKGKNGERDRFTLPWSLFMSLHGFISYCIHNYQTYEEVQTFAEDHVRFLCEGIMPADYR